MTERLENQNDQNNKIFDVERIYIKKSSFEIIDAPNSLLLQWKPEMNFEIKNSNNKWSENKLYEVVLSATLKIKIADKEICTCSVDQAGIFKLEGFTEDEQKQILFAHCADILYPYLRQAISDQLVNGSLPAVLLKPISFEAVYQQQKEQEKNKASESKVAEKKSYPKTHLND